MAVKYQLTGLIKTMDRNNKPQESGGNDGEQLYMSTLAITPMWNEATLQSTSKRRGFIYIANTA